ncbi:hypothetical protein [Agromyces sp. M3QZ16-3]|uniref:hypothetical protein n=1 Tax=Agromyces sp. M3QZ16-3 TaxID=3447585 RepID=UPI003F68E90B
MTGSGLNESEQWAFAVLSDVLDADVEAADITPAPAGTVDGRLLYRDGREGAVEVTELVTTESRRLDALLRQRGRKLDPVGTWDWSIVIDDARELPALVEHYPEVLTTMEHLGVDQLHKLPLELTIERPALRWAMETSTVQFTPFGRTHGAGSGRIHLSRGATAVWAADSDPIGEAVRDAVASHDLIARKLSKLLPVEADERHLFLVVGQGGLTDAAYLELAMPERTPWTDPQAPDRLTHLWVTSGFGHEVLCWERGAGWEARRLSTAS